MQIPIKCEVIWEDSTGFDGWWSDAELHDIIKDPPAAFHYKTVAHLVHRDRKCVIVAMSIRGSETQSSKYGELLRIPAKCVKELRIIEDA